MSEESSVAEDTANELIQDAEEHREAEPENQEQQETQQEQEKTVPLTALEAERKRRQEAEYKAWMYQHQQQQTAQKPKEDYEDEYTKSIKSYVNQTTKAEIQKAVEAEYLKDHPDAENRIKNELEGILQEMPELAYSIQNSQNRYAAAMKIINKFAPKKSVAESKKKIQENQNKPGLPHGSGKTQKVSPAERITGMSRQEFLEYRRQMRGR